MFHVKHRWTTVRTFHVKHLSPASLPAHPRWHSHQVIDVSRETPIAANRPTFAIHTRRSFSTQRVRISPMQMHHSDAIPRQQCLRARQPKLRRKYGPRRCPPEFHPIQQPSAFIPDPILLKPPSNDPSPRPQLCEHQLEKRRSPLAWLDQQDLHRQTRCHDQTRKARTRADIDPSISLGTSKALRECNDLETLSHLLREAWKISCPAQIHRPSKAQPLPAQLLKLVPRNTS